ncbi:hypothetical protein TEA_029510 [Camellia sinensis var. sinensis]|uniref:NPH3 domain-containing protein n=1 Tax=Camellia sinensis var. sinensis TaxID=542762 RepID=A0A4V3WLZ9_CAMSN|nr:hypothetical protein TEA_029510 [Camellia sinensis var. sinensis]
MEKLRGWKDLGVVDTIYEEDLEDFSASPSLSPPLSIPPTPLHSTVRAWNEIPSNKIFILIPTIQIYPEVLPQDPLAARSGYLKRQLDKLSEITLSPLLNITAETFTLVADFCYGLHVVITPFNVAALRVAAELLEMTETKGCAAADGENLRQKTEEYFCWAVALSREYVLIVFRSCLSLLPEAETTAALASRCVEALSLLDDGDSVMSCTEDLKRVRAEDFQIVIESMHCRLTANHDLLYRIVDLYVKEHGGELTNEQKTRICNSIDCTKLSSHLLMHAVQNPTMPLRFVVQAMFIDQLNTRHSLIPASDHHRPRHRHRTTTTLGAILQRDAALRQAEQLKASMDATTSRIQTLEKELDGMKKLLHESANAGIDLQSDRSASFRFSSENKIERDDKGSVSFGGFRTFPRRERIGGASSSSGGSGDGISERVEKKFGRKLISRLKNAFRSSKKNSESGAPSKVVKVVGDGGEEFGNGDVTVIKKDAPFHQRSRSLG